jgi:hypothetical protein
LHLGLRHPERALSLVVTGCGFGVDPAQVARHSEAYVTPDVIFDVR